MSIVVASKAFANGQPIPKKYTGEGEDFAWILPVPVPPSPQSVKEAGDNGKSAFEILERTTSPRMIRGRLKKNGCGMALVTVVSQRCRKRVTLTRWNSRVGVAAMTRVMRAYAA